jgi:dihydropteroate synthase
VIASQHHRLIETIADRIASEVLAKFARWIDRVKVRVAKPGAVPDAATVAVEVEKDARALRGERILELGRHRIVLGGRALVMAVVNATPDSFFDRGKYFDPNDPSPAVDRALALAAEGADLIDVGGETAQPSSPVLEPGEEIRRVVPVIERLADRVSVPISVDTYKPEVARAAIAAGASLINDTSGLADPRLADVAAETGAGIVCMHIPCHPKERVFPGYPDPVGAVWEFLAERTARIEAAGVPPRRIILDPGIGFGKTADESLRLTQELSDLGRMGYALLYACSRRTFLGELMGGLPPEDRLEGTVAMNAVAIENGADLVRVHDVRFFSRLTRMLSLIRRSSV